MLNLWQLLYLTPSMDEFVLHVAMSRNDLDRKKIIWDSPAGEGSAPSSWFPLSLCLLFGVVLFVITTKKCHLMLPLVRERMCHNGK